ncbi:unnamed protein product [Eruca vesicaria subsp. sativa]|uniref:F-box domain-containing protein n=1 Tax=Eruca vesicaria subsp. sativa TaxID=29727 RepID=A0ABC8J7R0_ERUVS|nr:unnamed protein product [Eruca vesicaria subsp. sativa]
MDSLTEDLWGIILVRLPLKSIATSKLVCKRWKTRLESPFLRKLFLSHHQNAHSLWSLILKDNQQEAVSHYGCEIWGLPPQQLGSYISTFITAAFLNRREKARVVAYTDVGLILIRVVSVLGNVTLYVANPVSRECVETDPPWCEAEEDYQNLGLATQTDETGTVLGYKVVLLYDAKQRTKSFNLLIYSSETGLWRQETVEFPYSSRRYHQEFGYSISLNGNLHWVARNDMGDEVVVSIDFYGSDHPVCRVTHFPDIEELPRFQRSCTVSKGSLMYMNVVRQGDEHKLSVWRLTSSWEWQLVAEISYNKDGYHNVPLAINPFDAETIYFWNNKDRCLVSMNVRIGEFVLQGKLDRSSSSDGCILRSTQGKIIIQLAQEFSSFVVPKWLYRIPTTVANNSRQPNSSSIPTFIWWPPPRTPQPNNEPADSSNPFVICTRKNRKQKQSVKGNSSLSTAHHVATANRYSMLEDI